MGTNSSPAGVTVTKDLAASLHVTSDAAELTFPQEAYVLLASK